MAATTSSTIPRRDRRGFFLVDVLCGLTLSSILLASVLSTFLLMGRSGTNAASYMTMDAHSRKALGLFARDARMANALTWNSPTSVTLLIPDAATGVPAPITYAWDGDANSATYRCFFRMPGDASSAGPREILARNVERCAFTGFDRQDATTTDGAGMKRIRLAMTLRSSAQTVVNATDQIAGSFVLRNQLSI